MIHQSEGTAPVSGVGIGQNGYMAVKETCRVVLVAPGFPSSDDDSDKPFLMDHARALVAAGLQVTVVCPSLPGVPVHHTLDEVKIIRVRYAPRRMETLAATGSMYKQARGFRALLAIPMMCSMFVTVFRLLRRGTTVAYGHWWIPGGIVAVAAGKCLKRPTIVHLHGSDALVAEGYLMAKVARRVLRFADIRLAASDELASWARGACGKDVDVLPMPLRFDRLPSPSPVPGDGFILGVGRLVHEKGFDVLIDAVASLASDERPSVVIIGVGPDRHDLDQRAANAGVDLHLPGAVSPAQLSDWYRRARIVVVPSRREGFGLVAAEAAAAGRAVVGTSVGGIPSVVQSGVSGILVPPADIDALATAIKEVDPEWGVNGPQFVVDLGAETHGRYLRQVCDDLTR